MVCQFAGAGLLSQALWKRSARQDFRLNWTGALMAAISQNTRARQRVGTLE